MNNWNKAIAALDQALGFSGPSKLVKRKQAFDNKTQEHVVWLEYRARTTHAESPAPTDEEVQAKRERELTILQHLLADITDARPANRRS